MKKIICILVCITLVTSLIVISPTFDVKAVETKSQSFDVKKVINDFVSNSKDSLSADDVVSFLNGNAQQQLASGTGFAFGSEYVFNPSSSWISVAALSSTKFIIAFSSGQGSAIIGDVSGNIITYGSKYVFNTDEIAYVSVAALSSSKFVVTYSDEDNSYYGTAVIGDVSGNTITFGSKYVFLSGNTITSSVAALSSSKFVVTYGDSGNSYYGTAVIGDVSGNTITYGSKYVYNPDGTFGTRVAALSSSKFVVTYSDSGNSYYGTAVIGDVSGNTITYGSKYVYNPDDTSYIDVAALSSSKFVVTYMDKGNSYYGTAVIGDVSGNTITFGSEYVYSPVYTSYIHVAALSSSKFVVFFNLHFVIISEISGNTISYGGITQVDPEGVLSYTSFSALSSTKIVVAYRDASDSYNSIAVVGDENPIPNIPTTPDGPVILGLYEAGTFSTSATDPDGEQVQYMFDWDADGAHDYSSWTSLGPSGHTASLQKYWTNIGTYVVKAKARDEWGILSDWSSGLTVKVSNPPVTPTIPSGPTSLRVGESGIYITSAIDPDGDLVQYHFDWDDGTISDWTALSGSGESWGKTHSWSNPGTYYVRAQARDEHGAESGWSDSLTVIVTENQVPVADANGPYTGTVDIPVLFDGSGSYDPDGTIVSYEWDFGDGEHGSGVNPSHEYDTPGTYTVTLTVEDNYGLTDTDTTTADIYTELIADANGPYEGIVGIPIDFIGSASGGKTPYSWYWSFGDNVFSPEQNPSHIYDTTGTYIISLRVGDYVDATDIDYTEAVIYPAEEVVADADGPYSGAVGEVIQFQGSAVGGTQPYSWYWEFGDGDISTLQNPTHAYTTSDSFTATLTVTDTYGMTDDDTAQVSIGSNPPSKPTINGPTSGKAGEEYDYTFSSIDPDGDDIYYDVQWEETAKIFTYGPYPSGEEVTEAHTWTEVGTYTIKVKAKDVHDAESDWSTLSVSMPRNKLSINTPFPFLWFLQYFLQGYPILYQLLQRVLRL